MGTGASTTAQEKLAGLDDAKKQEYIEKFEKFKGDGMSEEDAIAAIEKEGKMAVPGAFVNFKEFLDIDCCTSDPEQYKVLAETEHERLIEMKLPPGGKDHPHSHPVHQMYVISGAKLQIAHPESPDCEGYKEDVLEIPTGAAPILPAGPHQVSNIGETEAHIIFIEAKKGTTFPGTPEMPGFISPFDVYPEGYTKLAEDDDWFTGMMEMDAGKQDPPHSHREHFVYCLEGEAIAILPIPDMTKPGDFAEKMEVPIKPGACIPVPAGHHVVCNTAAETKAKLVFFERKK